MRKTHSIVSGLLILLTMAAASLAMASELGPSVGATFPHSLAAPDQSGKPQTLQSLMGEKGLAVFFVRSADWCPFCMKQLVDVNEFGVPRPTLYVIDRNKKVRLRYMEPTYRTRPDLDRVLREVQSLGL